MKIKNKNPSLQMTVEQFKQLSEKNQELVSCLCCRRCHHWNNCNAPLCPLDPIIEFRIKLVGEDKCTISKNKRRRLAIGLPLPYNGMTKKEFMGHTQWQNMSEEKRNRILNKLTKGTNKQLKK